MSTRRTVASSLLVAVCTLIVVLGMANAGSGPAPDAELVPTEQVPAAKYSPTMADTIEQAKKIGPTLERHPVPAQPGLPGWACLGTENVQNIHVRLSPGP